MQDPRLEKLAQLLVNFSIHTQAGQWVAIRTGLEGIPLARAVSQAVLEAGAHPTVMVRDDEFEGIILAHANDEQLAWVSPLEWKSIEEADALVVIQAESNTRSASGFDPARVARRLKARGPVTQKYLKRAADGELQWTLTNYPTAAYAQDADMSLRAYEDFVFAATGADQADPIAFWEARRKQQQSWVDWLKGKRELTVRGPNVDLKMSIEGRTFINDYGTKNVPGGEIFTGPVEQSVEGWIRYSYPAIRQGVEVEGIELTFEGGKVVQATAKKNQDFLLRQIDSDDGARYVGEFAIGTNYQITQFTRSILYDEKIGGTIHMALGMGYEETGSFNKSAIHWDMICDMQGESEIIVDGERIYQNGQFLLD